MVYQDQHPGLPAQTAEEMVTGTCQRVYVPVYHPLPFKTVQEPSTRTQSDNTTRSRRDLDVSAQAQTPAGVSLEVKQPGHSMMDPMTELSSILFRAGNQDFKTASAVGLLVAHVVSLSNTICTPAVASPGQRMTCIE